MILKLTKLNEYIEEPAQEEDSSNIKLTTFLNYPDVVNGRLYGLCKTYYGGASNILLTFSDKYVKNLPYPFHTSKKAASSYTRIWFLTEADADKYDPYYPSVHGANPITGVRIDINGDIPCYADKDYLLQILKTDPDAIHPIIKERLEKSPVLNPFEVKPQVDPTDKKEIARQERLNNIGAAIKEIFDVDIDVANNNAMSFNIPAKKLFSKPYKYATYDNVSIAELYNQNVEIPIKLRYNKSKLYLEIQRINDSWLQGPRKSMVTATIPEFPEFIKNFGFNFSSRFFLLKLSNYIDKNASTLHKAVGLKDIAIYSDASGHKADAELFGIHMNNVSWYLRLLSDSKDSYVLSLSSYDLYTKFDYLNWTINLLAKNDCKAVINSYINGINSVLAAQEEVFEKMFSTALPQTLSEIKALKVSDVYTRLDVNELNQ